MKWSFLNKMKYIIIKILFKYILISAKDFYDDKYSERSLEDNIESIKHSTVTEDLQPVRENAQEETMITEVEISDLESDFAKNPSIDLPFDENTGEYSENILQFISQYSDKMINFELKYDNILKESKILQFENEKLLNSMKTFELNYNLFLKEVKGLEMNCNSSTVELRSLESDNSAQSNNQKSVTSENNLSSKNDMNFESENTLLLKSSKTNEMDSSYLNNYVELLNYEIDRISKNLTDLELLNIVLKKNLELYNMGYDDLLTNSTMLKVENDLLLEKIKKIESENRLLKEDQASFHILRNNFESIASETNNLLVVNGYDCINNVNLWMDLQNILIKLRLPTWPNIVNYSCNDEFIFEVQRFDEKLMILINSVHMLKDEKYEIFGYKKKLSTG